MFNFDEAGQFDEADWWLDARRDPLWALDTAFGHLVLLTDPDRWTQLEHSCAHDWVFEYQQLLSEQQLGEWTLQLLARSLAQYKRNYPRDTKLTRILEERTLYVQGKLSHKAYANTIARANRLNESAWERYKESIPLRHCAWVAMAFTQTHANVPAHCMQAYEDLEAECVRQWRDMLPYLRKEATHGDQ